MNTHEALKELMPWAKPACEDRKNLKRLTRLAESYIENPNLANKIFIKRMIKELEGGQN